MLKIVKFLKQMLIHSLPPLLIHYSPISTPTLLTIRSVATLYLTAFYLYDISQSHTPMDKLIYLTDTGFFFTWLYFVLVSQARMMGKLVRLDQYVEIIFQSMFCIELFITVAYWTVIHPEDNQSSLFKNINWHGVPLLFLTLDLIFNSYRFIPRQYISIFIFSFFYMFGINLPYSLAVWPVYGQASDWVHWLTYVFIVGEVIATGILFGLCRVVYVKLKEANIREWVLSLGNEQEGGRVGNEGKNCGGTYPVLGQIVSQ